MNIEKNELIEIPEEGRPEDNIDPIAALIGVDDNAFSIMGRVKELLHAAGASREYREAYIKEAMSGNYDHVITTSVAYLNPDEYLK